MSKSSDVGVVFTDKVSLLSFNKMSHSDIRDDSQVSPRQTLAQYICETDGVIANLVFSKLS